MALGMFWALNIMFAAISTALLAVLLFVYGRNAAQIKSKFTLGLVVFAALFLLQNVAGMWIYMSMNDAGQNATVAVPMLLLNVTETAALGTLLAITWS